MIINENRWPDTIQLDSEHHKRYVPAWADSELRFRQRHMSRVADYGCAALATEKLTEK